MTLLEAALFVTGLFLATATGCGMIGAWTYICERLDWPIWAALGLPMGALWVIMVGMVYTVGIAQ